MSNITVSIGKIVEGSIKALPIEGSIKALPIEGRGVSESKKIISESTKKVSSSLRRQLKNRIDRNIKKEEKLIDNLNESKTTTTNYSMYIIIFIIILILLGLGIYIMKERGYIKF
jgi:hypothetical protein